MSALSIGTLLLTAASFAASLVLATAFAASGVFGEWNILLDADPNIYLKNFSTGRTIGQWGGRSFIHPNLSNLVYPVVRLFAEVAERLPFIAGSPAEIREAVALLVSPLATALRVPVLVALFRGLRLAPGWALTLAALDAAAFSTRLLGCMPESYALSGTLITVGFLFAVRTLNGDRPPGRGRWLVLLFVMIAVASLNVGAGAVILCAALWRAHPPRRAMLLAVASVAAAFALNAIAYEVSRLRFPTIPHFHPIATEHLTDGFRTGIERPGIDYPRALANAFLPPPPAQRPFVTPLNHHTFEFTLERGEQGVRDWDARTVLVLVLFAAAAAAAPWWPARHRPMYAAAAGLLLLGAFTHAIFGNELLLYTPQWTPAVMVLLAGLHHLPERGRRALGFALPLLVLVIAVANHVTLERMARILLDTA